MGMSKTFEIIKELNKNLTNIKQFEDYDSKLKKVKQILDKYSKEDGKISSSLRSNILKDLNIELLKIYKNDDETLVKKENAATLIVLLNEGLISFVWKNVSPSEDFLQCCRLAISKAIQQFNLEENTAFSTFASKAILIEGSKYFENSSDLKLPKTVLKLIKEIKIAKENFIQEHQKEPTIGELSEILGKKEKKIAEAIIADNPHSRFSELQLGKDFDGNRNSVDEYISMHSQKNEDDTFRRLEQEEDLQEAKQKAHYHVHGNNNLNVEENHRPLYEMRTRTRDIESNYYKNGDVDNLWEDDPHEWINKIEAINPNYYYNRMIGAHCSNFAELANGHYDPNELSHEAITKRNEFIRQAIYDNMISINGDHINSIELYPNCLYQNVDDALTRNDRIFNVGNVRGKVYLAALAFNLTYDELENLLVHSLGDRTVDFKNPYEVMLAYSIVCEQNSCEHFLELKSKYEEHYENNHNIKEVELKTADFQDMFWQVRNDDDVLNLLYRLPNENSQSARKIFCKEVNNICDKLTQENVDKRILDYVNGDMEEFEQAIVSLYNNPSVYKSIKQNMDVSSGTMYNRVIGVVNNGLQDTFTFIRNNVFNNQNLNQMMNGRQTISKNALVLVLFIDFCLSDEYRIIKKEVENGHYQLTKIFSVFKSFADKKLEDAGFDYIYLPNSFELFLAYCLLCSDPLNAFHIMINGGAETNNDLEGE